MSGFFAMEFSISTHLPLSYYAVMNEESQIEVRSAPGLIGVDGEHVQAKAVKIHGLCINVLCVYLLKVDCFPTRQTTNA